LLFYQRNITVFWKDDDDVIPDETRLADDLKSDNKNEEQVGNPQSKLVQDIMSRQAEQEVATRSAARTEVRET
jgi:hypothetical protein